MCVYEITISEEGGHKFEGECVGYMGGVWKKEGKGEILDYIIIPKIRKYEILKELMQNTVWKKTKGKNQYYN